MTHSLIFKKITGKELKVERNETKQRSAATSVVGRTGNS
jgi:hypothetical protein